MEYSEIKSELEDEELSEPEAKVLAYLEGKPSGEACGSIRHILSNSYPELEDHRQRTLATKVQKKTASDGLIAHFNGTSNFVLTHQGEEALEEYREENNQI